MTPLGMVGLACAVFGGGIARAEYTPRFSVTAHGALTMTGNALGLSSDGAAGPGTVGSIGAFVTTDPSLQAPGGWPAGTTTDWTLNAAAATLRLPVGATVLHAELVWGAYLDDLPAGPIAEPVRVTPPGGASVDVDPAAGVAFDDAAKDFYARAVDVTALVAAHGAGTWTVGHVPASLGCGSDCNLRSAGWTLVVAYARADLPLRDLGVWVGLEPGGGAPATLSGLCTPSAGDVRARVLVSALEGDHRGYGDNLAFGPTGGPLANLIGPNNNEGNFFAAHINGDDGHVDTSGTFGHLNLTSTSTTTGRQGWDITNVDASGVLPAGTTAAVAQGITSSEQYRVTAIGIQIDTGQPRFEPPGTTAVASPTAVVPGEATTLTWTLTNSGAEPALGLTLAVNLAADLSAVPNTFAIDGAPVAGADPSVAPYPLGTLAPGASVVASLEAVVAADPTDDVLAPIASVDWSYTACGLDNTGHAEVGPSPLGVARLAVELTAAPATPVGVADTVLFTARVTNVGAGATRSATLQVTTPAGLDYLSGTSRVGAVAIADVGGGSPFATPRAIADAGSTSGVIAPGATVTVTWQAAAAATSTRRDLVVSAVARGHRDVVASEVAATAAVTVTVCGDGLVGGAESCDDGGANSDSVPDACRSDCRAPRCGDGVRDSAEGCDDGDQVVADCVYGVESCLVCGAGCQEETGAARFCGDGHLDAGDGEGCDDGEANSDSSPDACRTDCREPRCGDGVKDAGERCDDGDDDDSDGCTAACDDRVCGDGRLSDGEVCDPGADPPGACAYGAVGCTRCRTDCAGPEANAGSWCGDGRVDLDHGEVCDDGNDYTELCRYGVQSCAVCGAGCRPTVGIPTFCGDGSIDSVNGELCDDGNARDHDGCSASCVPDAVTVDEGGCRGGEGAGPLALLMAGAGWVWLRRRRWASRD
ncbi:MAG: hypothetical protein CVU56_22660 [Deltaproteobacteria bacterium HGW-Deltaproteobacteria-14]|nr:MAG: hypothetical protein CVU56_22660 [Deltaproteobacteria bacterium HGW-Deltaproteobacteria-14]